MKAIYLLFISVSLAVLAGCNQSNNVAKLHTQAEAQQEVIANYYDVFVRFKQFAKDQSTASAQLTQQTAAFEAWANKGVPEKLQLKSKDLQAVYQYHRNGDNTLKGYHAQQSYVLKGLDKTAYGLLMDKLPSFKADSFNTQKVYVSDDVLLSVHADLRKDAFAKAKVKAEELAELANLCQLQAVDVREFSAPVARPMLMARESMAMSSAPKADAKQNLNVRLEVSWSAQACQ